MSCRHEPGQKPPGNNDIGVLLLNMGGPDSLEAVRPFLFNLFSDRKIIKLGPSFLQRPIAWIIARKRAPKSASNYAKIGGKSPLLEITTGQAKALEARLNEGSSSESYVCEPAMRYWYPRTPDQLKAMKREGIKRVIGLSMYPHYSLATGGSSIEEFRQEAVRLELDHRVIDSYPDHPLYVRALESAVREGMKKIRDKDNFVLVYSAHSLPRSMVEQGDPYVDHLKRTISSLEGLTGIKGRLCYQSRSGPVEWLEPATDEMLLDLASQGIREILCLPISFVSDHIETLFEIDILYGDMMREKGVSLVRAPSLNYSPLFIQALYELVLSSWTGQS